MWEEERWREEIARKSKLRNYDRWKQQWGMEEYLVSEGEVQGARVLTKLRSGANMLRIDQGRREGQERGERWCEVCGQGVEDEEHFMMRCLRYKTGRAEMMEEVKRQVDGFGMLEEQGRWQDMMDVLMGAGEKGERMNKAMAAVKKYAAWALHIRRKTMREVA